MKITIDIPEEFEKHFDNDRFEDSLKRIITDVTDEIESDFSISGRYEIELCEMLIEAFKTATKEIDKEPNNDIYVNLFDDPESFYSPSGVDYSNWRQGKDGF